MKKEIIVSLLLSVLILAGANLASAKGKVREEKKFFLPPQAQKVSDDVYFLGESKDKDGKEVEGYAYIYRAKGGNRPAKPPKNSSTCYGFLASGAKWKAIESYLVDPENRRGLDFSKVKEILAGGIAKWEEAGGKDILGNEISEAVDGADTQAPDDKNEVYFAAIDEPGAIAITIVWGVFSGPPKARELVEWDQVYDDTDYDWSAETVGVAGKMDFGNIATHELGHSVGMNDLYTDSCTEETMYGYAGFSETKKRDLNLGDIAGIRALYNIN